MSKLNRNAEIRTLAKNLGLNLRRDPVEVIREHCLKKVDGFKQEADGVYDLTHLLEVVRSRLGVKFEEIHHVKDISLIAETYMNRGELSFAKLEDEFDNYTDAVLIELRKAQCWEPSFVAIIDCRGAKKSRAYFSKWHELAHVLALPKQRKFKFYHRTAAIKKEPTEILMDQIAGDVAFYPPNFFLGATS